MGNTPAELQSAIGRAYYAAYNVGFETLREMGFHISRGPGGHGKVRHHLSNSGNTEFKSIASQLQALHTKRIHADYRMDRRDVETQKTARTLVEQANRLIQTLDRCASGPQRAEIIQAIRDGKQKISGASS